MNNCYVYIHYTKDTLIPFYVGKGTYYSITNKYKRSTDTNRNLHWKNIVNKHGYITKIVDDNISEDQAFELEIFLIQEIGRKDLNLGTLCNWTNGGEGGNGIVVSEKRKNIAKDIFSKPITQYSKSGEIIQNFKSIKDASEVLNIQYSTIGRCCRGERPTSGGFVFRFKGEDFTKFKNIRKRPVIQFTKSGEFINRFESATCASVSLHINVSNILQCCKHNKSYNHVGGYLWRYEN